MFIFMQDRKSIIGSFSIKCFRRTEDNAILAITEWATEDKPEKFEVMGEYKTEEDAKNVLKLIFEDMRRREQVFRMPKKEGGVAKMLKAAAERVALAKKQAAEREAKRIAAEKAAEERKAAKEAKAAAHEQKLAEQAAAKAKRLAAKAAATEEKDISMEAASVETPTEATPAIEKD